jgi:hypothetical protein
MSVDQAIGEDLLARDADDIADAAEQQESMDALIRQAGATRTPPIQGRATHTFLSGDAFVLDAPLRAAAVWGSGDQVAWAQGESLILFSPQGVGKSTVAGQLVAARLGLQTELMQLPVQPGQGRVLYLACDRPPQISRSMRRQFTDDDRQVLADRLRVHRGPLHHDITRNPEVLAQMCADAGADTCIVDSLKDVVLKLTDDEAAATYNRARQLALREGVELLELHHPRKAARGDKMPNTIDDVYGSTWITSGAGSVISLWGAPGDSVVAWSHLKQPAGEIGPMKVTHEHHLRPPRPHRHHPPHRARRHHRQPSRPTPLRPQRPQAQRHRESPPRPQRPRHRRTPPQARHRPHQPRRQLRPGRPRGHPMNTHPRGVTQGVTHPNPRQPLTHHTKGSRTPDITGHAPLTTPHAPQGSRAGGVLSTPAVPRPTPNGPRHLAAFVASLVSLAEGLIP